jgi:sporulation protein YlmC with PRC-barrel domain
MLNDASDIQGYTIAATDGDIGTVSDLLFEDTTWLVRWLVVDTGNWLPGRKVLLPVSVLGRLDPAAGRFPVKLTVQQIKDSPDIDTDRPVSRQMETNIYDYYGWSPYWSTGFYMGGYGYGGGVPLSLPNRKTTDGGMAHDDKHLRSVAEITGYHIHAKDGDIGHISDVLLEDADWSIHYLTVDTSNWLGGKKVLISPRSVKTIDWAERTVGLDVDRARVENSPAYESAALVDRRYEKAYHEHYSGF